MSRSWPDRWPAELAVVLALTPHPDDELFCAGLLARAAAGGARVEVACATGGGRGWVFGKRRPADEVITLRAAELEASCAALGVAAVTQLGFADSALGDDAAPAIARAIDDAAPDVIVSYAADGGYGHRDHVKLVELVAAALAGRAARPRWLQRAFPDGAFADTAAELRRSTPDLLAPGVDPRGARRDQVDWIVAGAPTEPQRRRALAAHASQRWLLDRLPTLRSDEEWYVEA